MISFLFGTFDAALGYMLSLDPERLVRLFWLFFFFDLPRYVLLDIYIFIYELVTRPASKKRERELLAELLENPPLVSVIVPALNEQDTIEWTIRSLKEQTYKNIEIIIVDDGSTDNTPAICSRLQKQGNITYFRFPERSGKSAVLNYGFKFAKGEFIVFVDSDTTFDRDALLNLVRTLANPRIGAVSGNLAPRNGRANLLTGLQHVEYLYSISIGRRIRAHLGILPIISGAFGGFRAGLVDTVGGHEPGPGNDADLTIRIRKLGYKVAFAPDAICLTNVPEKWSKLIKQRWRWDRNLIKNRLRKHRDVYNPFSENFRLKDLMSFYDSIFSHVVIPFLGLIYLVDIVTHFPEMIVFALVINYLLYLVAEAAEMLIAVVLSRRWQDLLLLAYLPIFNPYKKILKFFRLIGYIQELFFFYSYRDPFAPYKVRERMIRW